MKISLLALALPVTALAQTGYIPPYGQNPAPPAAYNLPLDRRVPSQQPVVSSAIPPQSFSPAAAQPAVPPGYRPSPSPVDRLNPPVAETGMVPPAWQPNGSAPIAPIYPSLPPNTSTAPLQRDAEGNVITPEEIAPVATPAPVARKDMLVRLRLLNKMLGEKRVVRVPMGTVLRYETLEILPERCWFDPAAKPSPAAAALIEIYERKPNLSPERLFSGWMFANDPAVSYLEHARYDVAVMGCVEKEVKKDAAKEDKKAAEMPEKPAVPENRPEPAGDAVLSDD